VDGIRRLEDGVTGSPIRHRNAENGA